tara:strand:+ start:151 stop:354 length:204 start_codon:yes stop_codon:yes gene_type:complete
MKLSNQALGAVMMALQKSILNETDIVPILKSFNFVVTDKEELNVSNPPTVEVPEHFINEEVTTVGSD